MRIGFIGLGNMGAPMAANLIAAGHEVTGFDVGNVQVDGVRLASSAGEAVRDVDAAITMLPDGAILAAVLDEIVPAMTAGALLLDCSTVDVDSATRMHERAREADLPCIDAPVSGGIGGARAGTLTFMAGGSEASLAQAAPLLDVMGGRTVHCGDGGAGQAAKICNNLALGIHMLGTCEAFALGERLGLDPARLFDVMSTSSGSSWSVNTYCPVPGVGPTSPADKGYAPGFAAELMLKDIGLALQAAEGSGAIVPMGERARELYDRFVADGGRGRDFSGVLPTLRPGTD